MAYQRGGYYDQHEMNYYDDSYHEDPGRQPHENPFAGGDLAESGGYYAQRPPLPQPPVQAQPQDTPYARGPSPPPVLVEQTSWESPYAHTNNAAAVDAQPYQEPNSLSSQPPFLNAPAHSSYGASSYALQDPGVVHPHTPAAAGEEGADEDPLLDNARYAGYNPTASASSSFPGSYPGGYAAGGVEDEHGNLVRYGKIPSRQPRRFKTVKRVELSNGNLVLDCPVPEKLLQMCTLRNEREFTHMRCASPFASHNSTRLWLTTRSSFNVFLKQTRQPLATQTSSCTRSTLSGKFCMAHPEEQVRKETLQQEISIAAELLLHAQNSSSF